MDRLNVNLKYDLSAIGLWQDKFFQMYTTFKIKNFQDEYIMNMWLKSYMQDVCTHVYNLDIFTMFTYIYIYYIFTYCMCLLLL